MKFRLKHFIILTIVVLIAIAWIYEARNEAKIDKHYQQNARITKEEAVQIAKNFIIKTMSESSHGYPKNINEPDRISDGIRKWTLVYIIREQESLPNTTVIEVDKIDGKPIHIPQR